MPWVFLLVGVFICCVATGVIPPPKRGFHKPWPIVFLTGMFFVCLGFLLFKLHDQVAMRFFMAVACGCLGTVALWCAFFGDGANPEFRGLWLDRPGGPEGGGLENGHPNLWSIRLSRFATPVLLGRIVFGVGGGLAWLLAGSLLIQWVRKR